MKSFRIRAWFNATPKNVIIERERAEKLGEKTLKRILQNSLHYKTSVTVLSQSFGMSHRVSQMFTKDSQFSPVITIDPESKVKGDY